MKLVMDEKFQKLLNYDTLFTKGESPLLKLERIDKNIEWLGLIKD